MTKCKTLDKKEYIGDHITSLKGLEKKNFPQMSDIAAIKMQRFALKDSSR